LLAACAGGNAELSQEARGIDASRIEAHMRFLAADELDGRKTASRGYLRAAEYVAARFKELGLEPAGEDGSYYQSVPLLAASLLTDASRLTLVRGVGETALEIQIDFVLAPDLLRQSAELTAPLVFVGFGVRAPGFDHDDYAGIDASGKIAVMFRGAPDRFPHNQRAFYSDSAMKRQTAAEQGAVGVVTMMLPADRATYPWHAVVADSEMSAMAWLEPGGGPHGAHEGLFVDATLSTQGERKLFEGEGRTLEQVFAAATAGESSSFDLSAQLHVFVVTGHERVKSPNVIARLAGHDAALADEHVVLTAHLDHLGSVPVEAGKDGIHNGAYDNSSGVAMLLEVASALASTAEPLRRSVLFVALTGEEKGLLGSEYFLENPSVDLDNLVADINLDMVLMLHPLKDVVAFGAEHSTLEQVVERAAREVGVAVRPDPIPERVLFVRGDQYPFVRKGIPSVFLFSGFDAGGVDGLEQFHLWMRRVYHTPADDMEQAFDFEAGADFARINVLMIIDVANAEERPRWNAGDFFGERFGN
jgi:Zn-dependent M28 family amino/carboxypeptidase